MKYKDYKQRLDEALDKKDITQERYNELLKWMNHLKSNEYEEELL